jgi:hypothetical protein
MQHSKTFNRKNGTQVGVALSLHVSYRGVKWAAQISVKPKGKDSFILMYSTKRFVSEIPLGEHIEYCTIEEIQEVKKELRDLIPLD